MNCPTFLKLMDARGFRRFLNVFTLLYGHVAFFSMLLCEWGNLIQEDILLCDFLQGLNFWHFWTRLATDFSLVSDRLYIFVVIQHFHHVVTCMRIPHWRGWDLARKHARSCLTELILMLKSQEFLKSRSDITLRQGDARSTSYWLWFANGIELKLITCSLLGTWAMLR